MRLLLRTFLSLAVTPLVAATQTPVPLVRDTALIEEVRRLIAARVMSTSASDPDTAALHRLITPNFVHLGDSGYRQTASTLLQYVGGQKPDPLQAIMVAVTQVEVQRLGNVLLADALVTVKLIAPAAAAAGLSGQWRDMNTLVRDNGRWRFAQHSETPVAALGSYPVQAAPDSASLGAFVGDFEGFPGVIDHITQRGSRLYIEEKDHPEMGVKHLVAAGAEAFYPENESQMLMVFVRDTTGRVTHYIARAAGGPLIISKRLR